MTDDLDARILAAHAAGDYAALVGFYAQIADGLEAGGDIDAACFFLTQAYVFALEIGSPERNTLNARLAAHGREAPHRFKDVPQ